MDDLGLINYNARLYDPKIGRFLSADTVTEQGFASQNYNRYAYARNNPVTFTDPSGHSADGEGTYAGPIDAPKNTYTPTGSHIAGPPGSTVPGDNLSCGSCGFGNITGPEFQRVSGLEAAVIQLAASLGGAYSTGSGNSDGGAASQPMPGVDGGRATPDPAPNSTTPSILKDINGNPVLDPNGKPYPLPPGFDIQRNISFGLSSKFTVTACLDDESQCFTTKGIGIGTYAVFVVNFFRGGSMDYQRDQGLIPVALMSSANFIDRVTGLDKFFGKFDINFNLNFTSTTNFNYGAVGAAAGFSQETLLRNAGIYNVLLGRSATNSDPYGNPMVNSRNIINGFNSFKNGSFGEFK